MRPRWKSLWWAYLGLSASTYSLAFLFVPGTFAERGMLYGFVNLVASIAQIVPLYVVYLYVVQVRKAPWLLCVGGLAISVVSLAVGLIVAQSDPELSGPWFALLGLALALPELWACTAYVFLSPHIWGAQGAVA